MTRDTSAIYNGKLYMPRNFGTTLEIYEIDKLCRIGAGIIESGVSADGASRYQITSDGILECQISLPVTGTATAGGIATGWNAKNITFPAEFNDANYAITLGYEGAYAPYMGLELYDKASTGFTSSIYNIATFSASYQANSKCTIRAKGLAKV